MLITTAYVLHRLNVSGMQCTSCYIGYGIYTIILSLAGYRDGRSKDFYTFQKKVCSCAQPATPPDRMFADQLHRVTDRPHKVNDRPHEVTDQPLQTHVRAFGFLTQIARHISLTCQMIVSCPAVHKTSLIKWVRSLIPRPPPSFSQSWERGGW